MIHMRCPRKLNWSLILPQTVPKYILKRLLIISKPTGLLYSVATLQYNMEIITDPKFSEDRLIRIFTEKKKVIDIGGGLRIDSHKNNRGKTTNVLDKYLSAVEYVVLDKVADYNPDIVGDIHDLPFADNSIEAITCVAVLEHVEEPQQAVREMYRVLKPGGFCYIYVPFLFYYHPSKGYYKDFYRFTLDGVEYMTKDFKTVEVKRVRGAFETVMNLLPMFSKRGGFFRIVDRMFGKEHSNQCSGFTVFCIK